MTATTTKTTAIKAAKAQTNKADESFGVATSSDIPAVILPASLALVGTALKQSRDGFAEVWAYEREHEVGLQALKLIAKAAKGIGAPLASLTIYGAASAISKLTGEDAKAFAGKRWGQIQELFSHQQGE